MATATQSPHERTSESLFIKYDGSKSSDNKICAYLCALINSHGGFLTISHQSGKDIEHAKETERKIRQKFAAILGFCHMRDVIIRTSVLSAREMTFKVEGMSQLCTLHYNIYIPTELQIIPLESADEVRSILQPKSRIIELDSLIKANDYHKDMVYGKHLTKESVCLESKTRQLKLVKDTKGKRTTLEDRMTGSSNKFANTVSAFANHRGGHVYYGVDDDGIVLGEYVEDSDEIIAKVHEAINKIIWLSDDTKFTPIQGQHWNISFEPVKDDNGREKNKTFVIVVYISYCSGGVFTKEPESYQVVSGNVVRIPFQEWKGRILQPASQVWSIARSNFRTTKSEENYYTIMEKMMDLRNQGERKVFKKYITFIKQQFKTVNVQLSTLSQEATCAFRSDKFGQAEKLIQAYDRLQSQCEENMLIPESMGLYIKSANQRAQGQYQEGYELAKLGLQTAEMLAPGLIHAWFCIHIALFANILANKESDPEKRKELIDEAKCLLGNALSYSNHVKAANKLVTALVDLQQKIYIHLSQLYIGVSLDGSLIPSHDVCKDDIQFARNCLLMVAELEQQQQKKLSPSRNVQYLLALSALSFREFELGIPTKDGYLEKCDEAYQIAVSNNLKEMIRYCQKLRSSFEACLQPMHLSQEAFAP